jgi:hypothetical protein
MPKLALRAQTVDIAYLPLRQDVLARIGSMNRSKRFRSGQHPVKTLEAKTGLCYQAASMTSSSYMILFDLKEGFPALFSGTRA